MPRGAETEDRRSLVVETSERRDEYSQWVARLVETLSSETVVAFYLLHLRLTTGTGTHVLRQRIVLLQATKCLHELLAYLCWPTTSTYLS